MRGRSLTAVEIDRLTHLARALKRAVNPDERERCETNLAHVVDQLIEDDVRKARMLPHLNMSYGHLGRILTTKRDQPPPGPPQQTVRWRISFDQIDLTDTGTHSRSESINAIDLRSANDHINSMEASGQAFVSGITSSGVTIALGVPIPHGSEAGRQLSINQEARIVQRGLQGRPTRVRPDATLVDLQHEALQRPFILHLAAHREFGLTTLAGPDGDPTPVLDEDLAKAIAPTEGAPAAIMLSFCDSHQVAALIEDRDIAVISFQGEILDDAARSFYWHLYEAISLGRPIGLAFEVAAGAVRGACGLRASINPYSSAHDRPLPRL
jgi:hypothetical protein